MPARNFPEFFATILNLRGPKIAIGFKDEFQDYLSHQVVIFLGPPPMDPLKRSQYNEKYDLLAAFCKKATGMAD